MLLEETGFFRAASGLRDLDELRIFDFERELRHLSGERELQDDRRRRKVPGEADRDAVERRLDDPLASLLVGETGFLFLKSGLRDLDELELLDFERDSRRLTGEREADMDLT